jgi:MFS family permease
VLAAFCLTLPHTPPAKNEGSAFAPLEAFKLLAVPSILVLFIVTFLDSLVHYCYFFWTSTFLESIKLPANWIAPAMSIGQIAEISTMAYLGFFLKRLGWRTTMILGILGHVIRFGIYAIGTPETLWLVILSNVVHGFAYAFFFATVYIYVDENFPKDIRTSAQSLFNLLILGLGPFLGNFLWGWLGDLFRVEKLVDGVAVLGADGKPETLVEFHKLFLVPLGFGIFAALILFLFFHPSKEVKPEAAEEFAV